MSVRPHKAFLTGLGLVLALQVAGCVGVGAVRSLPADAGLRAQYRASPQEVATLVPAAFEALDHDVVEYEVSDSGTHIVIGSRWPGLFSNGQHTRALLVPRADGQTSELRVVSRSRYALDLSGQAGRAEPRLLKAVDEALGADRIVAFPGLTIKGFTTGGAREVRGVVESGGTGVPLLIPEGLDATSIRLDELVDASVLRGSYSYARQGAALGSLIGLVALLAADPQCSPGGCSAWTPVVWTAGGTLAGFLTGSAIRTEIWSPAEFGPSTARSGRSAP